MGIHVSIVNQRGEEHPDWDWIRHAGDRDIPGLVTEVQSDVFFNDELEDEYYRPRDPEQLFQKLVAAHPYNEKRWRHLADLLSSDPDLHLHYSY